MPEKGEGGLASPAGWPRLADIRGDSACLNRFAADIMGSYTHYPLIVILLCFLPSVLVAFDLTLILVGFAFFAQFQSERS